MEEAHKKTAELHRQQVKEIMAQIKAVSVINTEAQAPDQSSLN